MKKIALKIYLVGSIFLLIGCGWMSYVYFFSRPYLTVIGEVRMFGGIGRQSVELISSLKDKMSIGFIPTIRPDFHDVPKDLMKILKNPGRPLGKVVVFEDQVWTPEKANYKLLGKPRNPNQIRLAYSLFYSTKIPDEWVEVLNTYFDAVVVPDEYLIGVYKNSGVKLPIFVLALGLNLQPFLSKPVKYKPHYPFVFGNCAACVERKNIKTLVEGFHQAFGNDESVLLKINSRYNAPSVVSGIENYIHEKNIKNIEISYKCLSHSEYLDYFSTLDCFINIAKGEGYSIQPREAMAIGLPVILSNNSAQSTICKTGIPIGVPSLKEEPFFKSWGLGVEKPVQYGYQYNCRAEDVAVALREMYDNYDKYLVMADASKIWASQFDYEHIKPLYLCLIQPKALIYSSENSVTYDGLYCNSLDLLTKFSKLLNIPIREGME